MDFPNSSKGYDSSNIDVDLCDFFCYNFIHGKCAIITCKKRWLIKKGDYYEEKKVTPKNIEYRELILLARNCSFQTTGSYFAELLENGELADDEYAFCALSDENKVIGFGALMRESCIENKEYTPMLDFLFVTEEFRKKGTARALTEEISRMAKQLGHRYLYCVTNASREMYEYLGSKRGEDRYGNRGKRIHAISYNGNKKSAHAVSPECCSTGESGIIGNLLENWGNNC